MSKTTKIREICGDYAFDVSYFPNHSFTLIFSSLRNARTVKKCIDVDDSIPNVATVADFVEVTRCLNCIYYNNRFCNLHRHTTSPLEYCSFGISKKETITND